MEPTKAHVGGEKPAESPRKVLLKGNEAIAEGAILAGCQAFFGYPITPQSEILEHMSRRMPELGRVFVQAESEVAAINMVYGASAAGLRVLTSSSGPGMSLKQEGISFLAAAELPAVIVNVMRAGPGLGGILPAQADYFQATKGGGHGDYRLIVLAPASVQEAMDLTVLAFDLADTYRTPVMILADGLIGQVMEPVVVKDVEPTVYPKPWALTGARGRARNIVRTLHLQPDVLEQHNLHLAKKFQTIAEREVRYQTHMADDADIAIVAYGSPSRVARSAVAMAREQGVRAGLFRPISLSPFPYQPLSELANHVKRVLVVELSVGQLAEDVRLAVGDRAEIRVHSRLGGMMPSPREVAEALMGWEGRDA